MTIPRCGADRRAKKTITDKVQLPRLYLAWLTPRHFEPGDAALDVVADVLAGGKNSRLYKRLVYDLQIAQDVSAFQCSAGALVHVPDHRHAASRVTRSRKSQKVIDEEIEKLQRDRSRRRTKSSDRSQPDRVVLLQPPRAPRQLRRQGRPDQRVLRARRAIPTGSMPGLGRYRALTRASIRDTATTFLPLDRRVELVVQPEK